MKIEEADNESELAVRDETLGESQVKGENPFWEFSIAYYRQPDVKACCLELQEDYGWDVNLLLFCCWASGAGYLLKAGNIQALHAASEHWRNTEILPVRQRRQALGKRLESNKHDSQPEDQTRASYKALLGQELAAEKHQQQLLYDCFSDFELMTAEQGESHEILESNLATLAVFYSPPSVNMSQQSRPTLYSSLSCGDI